MMTVSAAVSVMPCPPARVLSRNTKPLEPSANAYGAASAGVSPPSHSYTHHMLSRKPAPALHATECTFHSDSASRVHSR
jgi:hypothetical protein